MDQNGPATVPSSHQPQLPPARPRFMAKRTGKIGLLLPESLSAKTTTTSAASAVTPGSAVGAPTANLLATHMNGDGTRAKLSEQSAPATSAPTAPTNHQPPPQDPKPKQTEAVPKFNLRPPRSTASLPVPNEDIPDSTGDPEEPDDTAMDKPHHQLRSSERAASKEQGYSLIPPQVQKAFATALDDKPYRAWKSSDDDTEVNTNGALIPQGYQLFDDAEFPWICPIRTCRELFTTVFGLGKHFNGSHRASRLNDNTDGTFTDLGKYVDAEPGDGVCSGGYAKPPIVVSKQPSTAGLPMPEPSLEKARARMMKSNNQRLYIESRGPRKSLPVEPSSVDSPVPTKIPVERTTRQSRSSLHANPTKTHKPGLELPAEKARKGLVKRLDHKPYTQWFDPHINAMTPMFGALIPEGYVWDASVPDRPWICPVRSCRRLFKAPHDLGHHFKSFHRGVCLNDNRDGTFSIVEQNDTLDILVVSQNVYNREPVAPAMVPTYPVTNGHRGKTVVWVRADSIPPTAVTSSFSSQESAPARSVASSMLWQNICSRVGQLEGIEAQVKPLLKLPAVRAVSTAKTVTPSLHYRQVAALLIQATGEVNTKACSNCRRGVGLLDGCVSASLQVVPEIIGALRSQTLACANCLYQRQGHACSIKRPEAAIALTGIGKPQNGAVDVSMEDGGAEGQVAVDDTSHFSQSLRGSAQEALDSVDSGGSTASDDEADIAAALNLARKFKRQRGNASVEASYRSKRTKLAHDAAPAETDRGLEMEDWEAERGQIPDAKSEKLAISTSFAAKETLRTSSNVSIVDIIIPPGTRQEFRPEADKARVCLLMGGKLRVQVGNEDKFSIGSRGRFRIGPKTPCSVLNCSYENVILNVISETLHGTHRRRR